MATQESKVVKYYNKVQRSYDKRWMNEENLAMHLGFWDETTGNLHEALINQNKFVANELQLTATDNVFDAGCGVGGTAIWIAAKFKSHVTGVNIVSKQVNLARAHSKRRNADHLVTFKIADYADTRLAAQTFTKAYAIESICHSDRKKEVLREVHRLLKPGGRFVVIDAFLTNEKIDNRHRTLLEDWYEGWACFDLAPLDDFRRSLLETGFRELGSKDVTGMIMPSSKILFKHCSDNYKLKKLLYRMKLISKEDFGNTQASISQHYLYKNGIVCHWLLTLEKSA